MRVSIIRLVTLFLAVTLVAGCSGKGESTVTPNPTATLTIDAATQLPPVPLGDRAKAEADYTALRTLHTEISGIWEGLQSGSQSQCGGEFALPEPELMSGDHPVQADLRSAAIDLLNAVNLWQGECQNPRGNIPDEVISRGVLYVRAAGVTLDRVSELLGDAAETP